jgi:CBS domain containing-hemolysin-like protein
MSSVEVTIRLIAGLVLVLANGFFVAIEFALTRVRQYPEAEFDKPGLRRAWDMTQDLEIYLTSCQVGITASSIALGIVAEPALSGLLEPLFADTGLAAIGAGAILSFVIINLVHLTHGEQTPTYLGVERTKFVARYGAAPLYWFTYLISPIIKVGDTVAKATLRLFGVEMSGAWLETSTDVIETRADLRHELDSLLQQGDLPDERRQEIRNALTVGERPISEIMTPIDDIVYLSTGVDPGENLDRIGANPHTRLPLFEDYPAGFRGIVYVPAVLRHVEELLAGEIDIEEIAAPSLTVAQDTPVAEVVDIMQDEQQELALVTDDGESVGLVTATDAFEDIMGQLEDPLDVAPDGELLPGGGGPDTDA